MIDSRDRITIAGAIIISIIVVVSFGSVCAALFFWTIPTESMQLAMLLLGILGAGFTTVLNYWMGSSSGSAKKDETIRQTAAVAAVTAANVAATAAEKEAQ